MKNFFKYNQSGIEVKDMMDLKMVREIKGLTQQDVADILDIPKRTIESWESGARKAPDYVEMLINDKLLSLTRKQIEDEKKYVVVEFGNVSGERVIFSGSCDECNSYEDFKRKELSQEQQIFRNYATYKLVEYRKQKEHTRKLLAYESTLSENEKSEVVKIGDKEYAKYVIEFYKSCYNEKDVQTLKNSFDEEVEFTDLNEAKEYYMLDTEMLEEFLNPAEYSGDDFEEYKQSVLDREKEIRGAKTMEELADVLNKYSDLLDNGSEWYIED